MKNFFNILFIILICLCLPIKSEAYTTLSINHRSRWQFAQEEPYALYRNRIKFNFILGEEENFTILIGDELRKSIYADRYLRNELMIGIKYNFNKYMYFSSYYDYDYRDGSSKIDYHLIRNEISFSYNLTSYLNLFNRARFGYDLHSEKWTYTNWGRLIIKYKSLDSEFSHFTYYDFNKKHTYFTETIATLYWRYQKGLRVGIGYNYQYRRTDEERKGKNIIRLEFNLSIKHIFPEDL